MCHLFSRWEEEYTMRMDLQQKIADLEEVREKHTDVASSLQEI